MNFIEFLESPLCIRLCLALAHFLWLGTVIAVLCALTAKILASQNPKVRSLKYLKRKGAATSDIRYGTYVAGLLVMMLSVALTFAVVDVPAREAPTPLVQPLEPAETPMEPPAATSPSVEVPALAPAVDLAPPPIPPPVEPIAPKPPSQRSFDWQRLAPYATSFYLLGVILMLGRLLVGLHGGSRLRRGSKPVDDPTILAALAKQAKALGLTFTPAVAYCRRVVVPTVVGVLKPTILLPFSFATGLTPGQIDMLLAHELAHIRRYDPLFNVIQRTIEAILFFHPAVWFVSRKIRIERENCCDDRVLRVGGAALSYASSLISVAEKGMRRPRMAVEGVGAADRSSQLATRIRRLIGISGHERMRLQRTWLVVILLGVLLIPVARMGLSRAGEESSEPILEIRVLDAGGKPFSAAPVVPASRGYTKEFPDLTRWPDRGGWVKLEELEPGEYLFALATGFANRAVLEIDLPEDGLKTRYQLGVEPDWQGIEPGKPVVEGHTIRIPYENPTDEARTFQRSHLTLANPEHRIFPPFSERESIVIPPKGKTVVTIDWAKWVKEGIWAPRRGEDIREKWPTDDPEDGNIYMRAWLGNSASLPFEVTQPDIVATTVPEVTAPILYIPEKSDAQEGRYCWRIERNQPLSTDVWWIIEDQGEQGSTGKLPESGTEEILLETKIENGFLIRTISESHWSPTGHGTTRSESKESVPENAEFESVCISEPTVIGSTEYLPLWEGRFLRDGELVKRFFLAARVVAPDDPIEHPSPLYKDKATGLKIPLGIPPSARDKGATGRSESNAHGPRLQFRLVARDDQTESAEVFPWWEGIRSREGTLPLEKEILFDESDIETVGPMKEGDRDQFCLSLQFTEDAKGRFATVTARNIRHRLAIVFDGEICAAPVILDRIPHGKIQITGDFTREEAEALALEIVGGDRSKIRPAEPRESRDALRQEMEGKSVEALMEILQDSDEEWVVRDAAALALAGKSDPAVIQQLIDLLTTEDIYTPAAAARALGEIGAPALDALIVSASHEDERVRAYAALALGNIVDGRSLDALVACLSDENDTVRMSAAVGLGNLGAKGIQDPRMVPLLLEAATDESIAVRRAAFLGLLQTGDERALAPALAALHDVDPTVRANAAIVLGGIGDPRALESLTRLAAQDPHARVRDAARLAVTRIESVPSSLGDIHWGEEARGLQLGLRSASGDKPYRFGEAVEYEVLLRNNTEEEVTFRKWIGLQSSPFVQENDISLKGVISVRGTLTLETIAVPAGDTKSIEHIAHTIRPATWSQSDSPQSLSVQPGQYTVSLCYFLDPTSEKPALSQLHEWDPNFALNNLCSGTLTLVVLDDADTSKPPKGETKAGRLELRWVAKVDDPLLADALPWREGLGRWARTLRVRKDLAFEESDVEFMTVIQRSGERFLRLALNGGHFLSLALNDEATRRFAKLSPENIGRRMAIIFDGEIYSAPLVVVTFLDGRARISGPLAPDQAEAITRAISEKDQLKPPSSEWDGDREAEHDVNKDLNDQSADALVDILRNPDEPPEVREAAAAALGTREDPRVIEALIGLIRNGDWELKHKAADTIAKIGEPALERLLQLLEDANPEVRWPAARALGRIIDPRSVDPLIACLSDEMPPVKIAAADSLRHLLGAGISDERIVPALLEASGDEDANVRGAVILALQDTGDARAGEVMVKALNDPTRHVRTNAAVSLGIVREHRAVDPLIQALDSDDSMLRTNAAIALERIGDPRALQPLARLAEQDPDSRVRDAARRAVSRIESVPSNLRDIRWGEEAQGLQLGLRCITGTEPYRFGEEVEFQVILRNVTDQDIPARWIKGAGGWQLRGGLRDIRISALREWDSDVTREELRVPAGGTLLLGTLRRILRPPHADPEVDMLQISPGSHTAKAEIILITFEDEGPSATSSEVLRGYTTRLSSGTLTLQIENPRDWGWGEPVDGIRARLRPDGQVFQATEWPTFEVDIQSEREISLPEHQAPVEEAELDGVWYRRGGDEFTDSGSIAGFASRTLEREGLRFTLMPEVWVRNDDGTPMHPTPGKHTLRVSRRLPDSPRSPKVVSNAVTFSILPSEEREPSASSQAAARKDQARKLFHLFTREGIVPKEHATEGIDVFPKFEWDDIPTLLELAASTELLAGMPSLGISSYISPRGGYEGMVALWLIDGIRRKQASLLRHEQTGEWISPSYYDLSLNPIVCPDGMEIGDCELSPEIHRETLEAYRNWWQRVGHLPPQDAAVFDPMDGSSLEGFGRHSEDWGEIQSYEKPTPEGFVAERWIGNLKRNEVTGGRDPDKLIRKVYYVLKDEMANLRPPYRKEDLIARKIVLHYYDEDGNEIRTRTVVPPAVKTESKWGPASDGLHLSIEPVETTLGRDQRTALFTAHVRNDGTAPAKIFWPTSDTPTTFDTHVFEFRIRDQEGNAPDPCSGLMLRPHDEDFRILGPGETFERKLVVWVGGLPSWIGAAFDLTRPGNYTVRLLYHSKFDYHEVMNQETGQYEKRPMSGVWQGTLASNTVTITVSDESNEEVPWGEPVDGVRCRLGPDRQTFQATEWPTFGIDIKSERDISLPEHQAPVMKVELDGEWYGHARGESATSPGVPVFLSHALERNGLHFTLIPDAWVRTDDGTPMQLIPGKHALRVAARPYSDSEFRKVTSNSVTFEVLPREEKKTSASSPSAERQEHVRKLFHLFTREGIVPEEDRAPGGLHVLPKFEWADIPTLLELAESTELLAGMPHLGMSSHISTRGGYEGLVALRLIDGIRQKQVALLRHEQAGEWISPTYYEFSLNPIACRDGMELVDCELSPEIHREALEAYRSWWRRVGHLPPRDAAVFHPMDGSSLEGFGQHLEQWGEIQFYRQPTTEGFVAERIIRNLKRNQETREWEPGKIVRTAYYLLKNGAPSVRPPYKKENLIAGKIVLHYYHKDGNEIGAREVVIPAGQSKATGPAKEAELRNAVAETDPRREHVRKLFHMYTREGKIPNEYRRGVLEPVPHFEWTDIPYLLELAESEMVLKQLPQSPLSSGNAGAGREGMIAIWVIEALRSHLPLDPHCTKESLGSSDELAHPEIHREVVRAYQEWWQLVHALPREDAALFHPLDLTDIRCAGKDSAPLVTHREPTPDGMVAERTIREIQFDSETREKRIGKKLRTIYYGLRDSSAGAAPPHQEEDLVPRKMVLYSYDDSGNQIGIRTIETATGGTKPAPGPLEGHDQPGDSPLSWAEGQLGIQLGLRCTSELRGRRFGEVVEYQVILRNAAERPVRVEKAPDVRSWSAKVRGSDLDLLVAEYLTTGLIQEPTKPPPLVIPAGATATIDTIAYTLRPVDWEGTDSPPALHIAPGTYSVFTTYRIDERPDGLVLLKDFEFRYPETARRDLATGRQMLGVIEDDSEIGREPLVRKLFHMLTREGKVPKEYQADGIATVPRYEWSDIPYLLKLAESEHVVERLPSTLLASMPPGPGMEGMVALWLIEGLRAQQAGRLKKDQNVKGGRCGGDGVYCLPVSPKCPNQREVLRAYQEWWRMVSSLPPRHAAAFEPLDLTDLTAFGREAWERWGPIEPYEEMTSDGILAQRTVWDLRYDEETHQHHRDRKIRTVYYTLRTLQTGEPSSTIPIKRPFPKEMLAVQKIILHYYDKGGNEERTEEILSALRRPAKTGGRSKIGGAIREVGARARVGLEQVFKSPKRKELFGLDITDAPRETDRAKLPDLFEERPPGSGEYQLREDVVVARHPQDWQKGVVYYAPAPERFYVVAQPASPTPPTFYGPFEGRPWKTLGIPEPKASAQEYRFAIHLVADAVDLGHPEDVSLDRLHLSADPVITEHHLVEYDWDQHTLVLLPEAIERLPKTTTVWGNPFVVVADGQPCYLGAFMGLGSSYLPNLPICYGALSLPGRPRDSIRIEGGPVTPPGEEPREPRNHPQVRQVLEELGKLRIAGISEAESRRDHVARLFHLFVTDRTVPKEDQAPGMVAYPRFEWTDIPYLLELAQSTDIAERMPASLISSYAPGEGIEGLVALWFIEGLRNQQVTFLRERQTLTDDPSPCSSDGRVMCTPLNPVVVKAGEKIEDPEMSPELHRQALEAYQQWWAMVHALPPDHAAVFNPFDLTNLTWMGPYHWERVGDLDWYQEPTPEAIVAKRNVWNLKKNEAEAGSRPDKKIRTIYYSLESPAGKEGPAMLRSISEGKPLTPGAVSEEMLTVRKIVLHYYDDQGEETRTEEVFPLKAEKKIRKTFLGLDLTDVPHTTDWAELPDLFEERPPGSKSYHVRDDVVVGHHPQPEKWILADVYYIPRLKQFYVQSDPIGSSTMTFYGPFEGEPWERLGIPEPEKRKPTYRFAIYPVEHPADLDDCLSLPLDKIEISPDFVITENDILAYSWTSHTLQLESGVIGRLPKAYPCIVVLNGERCYLGRASRQVSGEVPFYSSNMHHGRSRTQLHDRIHIEPAMGTRVKPGDTDPRDDPRIRDLLDELGKLVDAGFTIQGGVFSELSGDIAPGISVDLWNPRDGKRLACLSGKDGTYRFKYVQPAEYSHVLMVRHPVEGAWTDWELVDFKRDNLQSMDLYLARPQSISGTVRDAESGEPVPGADLRVSTENRNWAAVVADSEGRYRLYLQPRKVVIKCLGTRDRYWPAPQPKGLSLAPDEHRRQVDFDIESSPSFTGRVLDQDGTPAAGAQVYALRQWPTVGGGIFGCSVDSRLETDERGYFTVFARRPVGGLMDKTMGFDIGAWLPDWSMAGGASTRRDIRDLPGETFEIVLHESGSATVRIVDSANNPVTNAKLVAGHVRYPVDAVWPLPPEYNPETIAESAQFAHSPVSFSHPARNHLGSPVQNLGGGRYRLPHLIPRFGYYLSILPDAENRRRWADTPMFAVLPGEELDLGIARILERPDKERLLIEFERGGKPARS